LEQSLRITGEYVIIRRGGDSDGMRNQELRNKENSQEEGGQKENGKEKIK
jgi:hypothetical protein